MGGRLSFTAQLALHRSGLPFAFTLPSSYPTCGPQHTPGLQALKQVRYRPHYLLSSPILIVSTAAPAPPTRGFRLRRLFLYTSLSLTSLSLGIYLASLPFTATILASIPRPSSSSKSSLAYLPTTERSAEIEHLMTTHPLSQHLRSLPGWQESRPHAQMPEPMRRHSLTASALAGDTKIPVPPLIFTKGQGEELVAISYLGNDLCGH
ncbi:MAG: hypothetical protein Q9177_005992, partial [Variospora cf. flavescens]